MSIISSILTQASFSSSDLVKLLGSEGDEMMLLFETSNKIKQNITGNKVYFRGLIEFTNFCIKDCLYCGIRKSNHSIQRYNLSDEQILDAVRFAEEENFASIVLQSGENTSSTFTERITHLITRIKDQSQGRMRITLSLGEQSESVYRQWHEAGAHRYLLRIETTNHTLYQKIHPKNSLHDFNHRLDCLYSLRSVGFQTGTGVMIGLPFQTIDDLANDLLFFQKFGIDMVGMGPYLEHSQTPLFKFRNELMTVQKRFELSLKMIAVLRILMNDINIAATTALQAIDPMGREKGIKAGANVIMPNITPGPHRKDYLLYESKPCPDEEAIQCKGCLDARIAMVDAIGGYGEWGDSKHFQNRTISE